MSFIGPKPSTKYTFWGRFIVGIVFGGLIHHSYWNHKCTNELFPEDYEFFNSSNSKIIASTTEMHHLVFAIGGGADYWEQRWRYSELWWVPNNTRGYVWLENLPPVDYPWPQNAPPFKLSETTERFQYTHEGGLRSAIHLARTVKETVELNLTNVRWFIYGDDDTIFFVENLVSVLRKYDHNQMYYIGHTSETHTQNVFHSGNMAFGGGGYAISYELAKELAKNIDGCIDRYASAYGCDLKLHGCIAELGVSLTQEPGFHQLDVRDDIYGILAAHPVAPLVSLHHPNNFNPLFPGMSVLQSIAKLKEAYKVDPGRTLQQSFCSDKVRNLTISVSWGYTVQIYRGILRPKILEKKLLTFGTYNYEGPLTFDTRYYPEKPCDQPIIYYISEAYQSSDEVSTTYKKINSDINSACIPDFNVDNIKIFAARLEESYWYKAPQRQCCEVLRDMNINDDQLVIKIRSCRQYETTVGYIA